MPEPIIGGSATAYVPNVAAQIALGYTGVRFYWSTSETGTFSLVDTATLVAGTYEYSYNKTDALATDWYQFALYGATPGEGPLSEPMPIGPPRVTRKDVRRGVGRRLRLLTLATVLASPSPTTTTFASTNLIDTDASEYRFANWFARGASATRRVRDKTNAGYTPSTGVVKVNAFSGAPDTGDEIELWRPKGDEDPSELIDEAMNRARFNLLWEDTFYFTTEANVTSYWMPATMRENAIKRVDYAADTYPERPRWSPVGGFWTNEEQGGLLLDIAMSGFGRDPYPGGTVIRVIYNRSGDKMDDDTDYWEVRLEWAVAESAMALLNTMGPSGGMEQTIDVNRVKADLAAEIGAFRQTWAPSAMIRQELPR